MSIFKIAPISAENIAIWLANPSLAGTFSTGCRNDEYHGPRNIFQVMQVVYIMPMALPVVIRTAAGLWCCLKAQCFAFEIVSF